MAVSITVPSGHANISPIGFHGWANQFANPAARSDTTEMFSPVPYYLYCHALGLALKAYLLVRGVSIKALRDKFGHDLCKVMAEAKKHSICRGK